MDYLKKAFSSFSCRCCYIDDTQEEPGQVSDSRKTQLDISPYSIPKVPSPLIQNDPSLDIIVIESEKMQVGKVFHIDSTGMKNSDRQANDGQVFAGSLYYSGSKIANDILLPMSDKGIGKQHFLIQYKKNPGPGYFLKDLGDGMGTFVRVSKPVLLKNNYIVSFGDSHLIVFLENSGKNELQIKFIDGPKCDQKFEFLPSESPVRIGRMTDCKIRFDDNSLSRYHCYFMFQNGWYVQDGDGVRISTNGTWLFAEDFFMMFNGMMFKAGETLFRADIR